MVPLGGGGGLAAAQTTATPIKHLLVVFQENVSFDHYFGTYPRALNLPGEPHFVAAPGTPSVNGLTEALLLHNPNKANPSRLSPQQAVTCDMDHDYTEQQAFDGGLMDRFVEFTSAYPGQKDCDSNGVMAYFGGNTVTALWNYAQNFAISGNSFATTFGPSTPGAETRSGNTHDATLRPRGPRRASQQRARYRIPIRSRRLFRSTAASSR